MGIWQSKSARRHPEFRTVLMNQESLTQIDEGIESQLISKNRTFSTTVRYNSITTKHHPSRSVAINRRKQNKSNSGKLVFVKLHILIVDDGRQSLDAMRSWFQSRGNDVVTFTSGNEAGNWIQKLMDETPSRINTIDLVVCDLNMLFNKDPFLDFLVTNNDTKHIPVIVTSVQGIVSIQSAERSLRRGAEDFMYKPIYKNILLQTAQYIIDNINLKKKFECLKKELFRCKQEFEMVIQEKINIQKQIHIESIPFDKTFLPHIPDVVIHVMIIDEDSPQKTKLLKWLQRQSYRVTNCSTESEAEELMNLFAHMPENLNEPSQSLTHVTKISSKNNNWIKSRENACESHQDVDLVVCSIPEDEERPDYSLLKRLRHNTSSFRSVPFILCSHKDFTLKDVTSWSRNEITNFLVKPFSEEVHFKKISRICDYILMKKKNKQFENQIAVYKEYLKKEKNTIQALIKKYRDVEPGSVSQTNGNVFSAAMNKIVERTRTKSRRSKESRRSKTSDRFVPKGDVVHRIKRQPRTFDKVSQSNMMESTMISNTYSGLHSRRFQTNTMGSSRFRMNTMGSSRFRTNTIGSSRFCPTFYRKEQHHSFNSVFSRQMTSGYDIRNIKTLSHKFPTLSNFERFSQQATESLLPQHTKGKRSNPRHVDFNLPQKEEVKKVGSPERGALNSEPLTRMGSFAYG